MVPAPSDADAALNEMVKQVERLSRPDPEPPGQPVVAVGVGVAGLVRYPSTLVWGPHTHGIEFDLGTALGERLSLPVVVDNDANFAARAEALVGAAQGYSPVLMVTMGTGIGGGIWIDGSVYRGKGFAGEIGHMRIVPDGAPCACGQRGCWETVCSGRRLDELAVEVAVAEPSGMVAALAGDGRASGRHLTAAAQHGDPAALRAVEGVAGWLAVGIANLIAVLDPEVVVVGGGIVGGLEILLEPCRRAVAEVLEGSDHRTPTPMVAAALGQDAGLIGAGLAALETVGGC
jgi:glucokinase